MSSFATELALAEHAPEKYAGILQSYAREASQDLAKMQSTWSDVRNTDLATLQVTITNFVAAEIYNWLKDAPPAVRDVFVVAASALEGALSGFAAVEFVSTATIFAVTGLSAAGLSTAAGSLGAQALGWAAGLTAAGSTTMGIGAVIGCLIAAGIAIAELIDFSKPATYSSPQDCYNRMTIQQQAFFTYMQKGMAKSGANKLAYWWASDFQNIPNRKKLWVFSSYNEGFGYAPLGFAFCDTSGWNGLFYRSGRIVPETAPASADGIFYPPYAWGTFSSQFPKNDCIRFLQDTFKVTRDQAMRMAETAYWRMPPFGLWYEFIKDVTPASYDDRTGAQTTNLDMRGYYLEQYALLAIHGASPAEFAALTDTLLGQFVAHPGIGKDEEPVKVRALTAIRQYYMQIKSSWEHFDFGAGGAGIAPPALLYTTGGAAAYAAANASGLASGRGGDWRADVAVELGPKQTEAARVASQGGATVIQYRRLLEFEAAAAARPAPMSHPAQTLPPAARAVAWGTLLAVGVKIVLLSRKRS